MSAQPSPKKERVFFLWRFTPTQPPPNTTLEALRDSFKRKLVVFAHRVLRKGRCRVSPRRGKAEGVVLGAEFPSRSIKIPLHILICRGFAFTRPFAGLLLRQQLMQCRIHQTDLGCLIKGIFHFRSYVLGHLVKAGVRHTTEGDSICAA